MPKHAKKQSGNAATPLTKIDFPLTVTREDLLVNGSDNEFRELVHNSLAFTTLLHAVREGYGELIGLTGIQYTILVSVAHLGEEAPGISEIATHLNLSGTFVTTETGKLVKEKLIAKQRHPVDGRRVVLQVTDKGLERLRELSKIQQVVNNEHFACLSREDFINLRRIMRELVECTDRSLSLLRHSALVEKGIKLSSGGK